MNTYRASAKFGSLKPEAMLLLHGQEGDQLPKGSAVLLLVCALCGLLLPRSAWAAEIPELILPNGVGVNIHFTSGHQKDLDKIAAAGFRFIRMDFAWTATEPKKGEYEWTDYESLLNNLDQRHIRALFILDYSHPLYEETVASLHPLTHQPHHTTAGPQHPESIAAFARWAAAAAKHFQGRHILWEIWNEPNGNFWAPQPDAAQYSALALAAAKAVREADPQATILAPASSGFPWDFLETFLKSGVLQYLDAVSVHPYRGLGRPPETAAADYDRLRQLIQRYAPQGKRIPILSGEWGYSSHNKGVSLQTQSDFAARQQLANLLVGVPLSIWYDWKNDGDDPNENEHNFGTVTPDLKPKPAYIAIQTLTRELYNCRIERRLPLPLDKDYILVLVDAKCVHNLAAWTLIEPHSVTLPLNKPRSGSLDGVRGSGQRFDLKVESKSVTLQLSAEPQYIALGKGTVK